MDRKRLLVFITMAFLVAGILLGLVIINLYDKKNAVEPVEPPVQTEIKTAEKREDVIRETIEEKEEEPEEKDKVDVEEGELERLMRSIAEKTK